MPDDLDNLIRAAMKTLDEQVPSGYFEALPNQTLARLDEGSMQHGSSGTTSTRDKVAPPPVLETENAPVAKPPSQDPDEREEDSGLHDIRNLAQSTRQRMSSRRITQNPPIDDDDMIAASSGSFKNIALPQPARMVSLPEIADLPQEEAKPVKPAKAAKPAKKDKPKDKAEDVAATPAIAQTNLTAIPAAPVLETRQAFTLPSQQRKGSKAPLIALVGTGLAAAAGYVIFLQVNKSEDTTVASSAAPAQAEQTAAAPAPTVAATPPPPAAEPAPAAPPVEEAKAAEADATATAGAVAQLATDDASEDKASDSKRRAKAPKPSKGKTDKVEKPEPKETEVKPVEVKQPEPAKKPAGKGEEGEPSFDALLKEAGVEEKKEAKPKLDKKSLTGDDFKKGMASVTPKAKACYKGTQGTAMIKLSVSPSGQVTKVTVTGDFTGKPEAKCIEAAIKSASFPPWDGGPQSFSTSVLLAD